MAAYPVSVFGFGGIRRAVGLISAGVVVVTGLVATPQVASAVTGSRPTAIAVAADGTSYVGFAAGGSLARLDADGDALAPLPVGVDGPVDGLAVDPGGNVWVDDGDSIAAHRADGSSLVGFAHDPATACPDDAAHDPASYGGIAVTATSVYVAGRCSGDLEVYSRAGILRARVDLPGTALPRGVAWGTSQNGRPAMLYVAQPAAARVLVYDADALSAVSAPLTTLAIAKVEAGHATPVPSGLAVDRYGQLVVADRANHALYLYDVNNALVRYRVLGHPPTASSDVGRLDGPTALAQHDQDGGAMAGGLWIADAGNGRVQRWTTSGWTTWTADVTDPVGAAVPANVVAPSVTGTPAAGRTVTCDPGTWRPAATTLRYGWTRDGLTIAGAASASYAVTTADEDTDLACVVTAVVAAGSSAPATSVAVPVPGPRSVPVNLTLPTLVGTARPGETLTCGIGTWTGSPTSYARAWLRDGATTGDTGSTYYLAADDEGHTVSCKVRAANATGSSGWAVSAGLVVDDGTDPGGIAVDPPENVLSPSISGTARPGGRLTCSPGTWTGSPALGTTWRWGATTLGSGSTYTVRSADVGRQVVCTVRATNRAGVASASSSPVLVGSPTPTASTCRGVPSVTVDRGAEWTRSRDVVLTVRAPAGATRLEIADNPDFTGAQRRTLSPGCAYRWRLYGRSSRVPQLVYVRFPGAADPITPVVDAIRYDGTAPTIVKAHARWSNARRGWVLTVRAVDDGIGVSAYELSKTSGLGRRTYPQRHVTVQRDRSYLARVRFVDRLGNRTGWVSVQFLG